jgi:hypothetical protein
MNQSTRNRLLAGTFALFAARLILSAIRTGPVLVADEIGYLTNARVLAGGIPGQLSLAPFYRGGYSLLLAPLIDLGSGPGVTYHLILGLNAALAASVFPLLYLLLTRFGGARPGVAIWAALAGAVYPALTVLSQAAMSENALFPLVCLWLIAFAGLLAGPTGRRELLWAAALGVATGALWAVHNRMGVAVLIALAGLAWLTLKRRLRPAALAVGVAVVAVAMLGVHLLDSHLIDRNYAGSAPDELSERVDDLIAFGGVRTALANLIGQTWYLLATTFGLAAAALGDYLPGRRAGPGGRPAAPVLGVLLALTTLLLLISATAFPERTRPDMLVYGRYTAIVAPPLVAFGLVALGRGWSSAAAGGAGNPDRRRALWALGGFAGLTAIVVAIRATASDPDAPNRWNISSLPFLTAGLGPAILLGAAIVSAAGAWLLLRAAALGPRAPAAVAVAMLGAVVAYGIWNPVRSSQLAVYPAGWESPRGAVEASGAGAVSYDLDRYDALGLYGLQWFLPRTKMRLFHAGREPPPSRLVISGRNWNRTHPSMPAKLLWSEAGRDQALWELRGR